MIQLGIWRWRDALELSGWTQNNLNSTYRKDARRSESEKEVKMKPQDCALKVEDRTMDEGNQAAAGS